MGRGRNPNTNNITILYTGRSAITYGQQDRPKARQMTLEHSTTFGKDRKRERQYVFNSVILFHLALPLALRNLCATRDGQKHSPKAKLMISIHLSMFGKDRKRERRYILSSTTLSCLTLPLTLRNY